MEKISFKTTQQVSREGVYTQSITTIEADLIGYAEFLDKAIDIDGTLLNERVAVGRFNSMTFAIVGGYGVWCTQIQARYNPDPISVVQSKGHQKIINAIRNIEKSKAHAFTEGA